MVDDSPWRNMRQKQDIEDRSNDPWPWHQLGAKLKDPNQTDIPGVYEVDRTLEPISPLAMQLGATNIAPLTPEEMMKFIVDVEMLNPYKPKSRKR